MIQLDHIKGFFPTNLQSSPGFRKYMLKEYIQLLILDFLSTTKYCSKITFIGGTNLRLVKGIDRFSEDIDLDCKDFQEQEFMEMTNEINRFLQLNGFQTEIRDRENSNLKAFRRSIHFPELLYKLGLTGHREERFLIKIECQDQNIAYQRLTVNIRGCGFYFPFPVPSDAVLCSMKISALLTRHKGRDFYDVMFLLQQTQPDYSFLSKKHHINNPLELQTAIVEMLNSVDLQVRKKDFEHLLFNRQNSERVLLFKDFINDLIK